MRVASAPPDKPSSSSSAPLAGAAPVRAADAAERAAPSAIRSASTDSGAKPSASSGHAARRRCSNGLRRRVTSKQRANPHRRPLCTAGHTPARHKRCPEGVSKPPKSAFQQSVVGYIRCVWEQSHVRVSSRQQAAAVHENLVRGGCAAVFLFTSLAPLPPLASRPRIAPAVLAAPRPGSARPSEPGAPRNRAFRSTGSTGRVSRKFACAPQDSRPRQARRQRTSQTRRPGCPAGWASSHSSPRSAAPAVPSSRRRPSRQSPQERSGSRKCVRLGGQGGRSTGRVGFSKRTVHSS